MSRARRRGRRASQEEVKTDAGWMDSGSQISTKAKEEQRRAERRREVGNVNRFWLKPNEEREVLILDAKIEDCVAFHEHHMKDPSTGRWSLFEGCPKEWEICPLCESHGESYYAMFISVLDLTPFTVNQGKEDEREIAYSRKMLVVKSMQIPDFTRLMSACIEEHGTMRGMVLLLGRDDGRSARIGKPIPIDGKVMYDFMEEDEIRGEFGHEEVKGQDGKVFKEKNADLKPFDYSKIFEKPSAKKLREIYGGRAAAGSREDDESEWGEEEEKPKTRRSIRSRQRAREEEPSEEEPSEDGFDEDVPF